MPNSRLAELLADPQAAFEAAAARTREGVKPSFGRQESAATTAPTALVNALLHSTDPMFAASTERAYGGDYNAGPVVDTLAGLTGGGMMRGAMRGTVGALGGAPLRGYHRSNETFDQFDINKSNKGNAFGRAIYVAPRSGGMYEGYGPRTYEVEARGRPISVDVGDPADVARFNKEIGTNMSEGGFFERWQDQEQLPELIRKAGYDRLEVRRGDNLLEAAVYNPEIIEILRRYALIGVPSTAALAAALDNRGQ